MAGLTSEDIHLHETIMSYVMPLQGEINELRKALGVKAKLVVVPDATEKSIHVIEQRIALLQKEWTYYTKPRNCFSYDAQLYYQSIPIRLAELQEILKLII